ncbi:hypothetical protein YC2023_039238 [Brassica napus]
MGPLQQWALGGCTAGPWSSAGPGDGLAILTSFFLLPPLKKTSSNFKYGKKNNGDQFVLYQINRPCAPFLITVRSFLRLLRQPQPPPITWVNLCKPQPMAQSFQYSLDSRSISPTNTLASTPKEIWDAAIVVGGTDESVGTIKPEVPIYRFQITTKLKSSEVLQ